MAEAAAAFAPVLESVSFKDPAVPLFSNVTGAPVRTGEEAKGLAFRQITEPVRWTDEEAAVLAALKINGVLETGPGKVLQGLWKEVSGDIPAYPAGKVEEIDAFLKGEGEYYGFRK
jgi:[acyl-carrier-protein] S-malonyltransferase